MSDTKCIIVRKQLTVSDTKVTPCCNFSKNIPLDKYEEEIEKYAKLLDDGVRIDECRMCWDTEDSGFTSVRQSGNQSAENFDGDGITSLDIRIHNKCNLACNMCHPSFSTLWGKLKNKEENNFIPQSSLDKVTSLLSNVRKISLQGGEPFYGDEYVNFVDGLENKDRIELDTFTNVVTVNMDAIQRWSEELHNFRINASVDGIGETFEYIRWPAKWSKFERNAKKIYEIIGGKINFFYTIQAENINSILPFLKWRNENCPNSRMVFTTVFHNDEVTYKGLTAAEKQEFLNSKKEILSLVNYDPEQDVWHNREYNDLMSLFNLVENVEIDETIIQKRKDFAQYTIELREKHKE
jgi:molybdenum cofactor biosynthesis enzyme MoaA